MLGWGSVDLWLDMSFGSKWLKCRGRRPKGEFFFFFFGDLFDSSYDSGEN